MTYTFEQKVDALRELEGNITQLLCEYEQKYAFSVSGVVVYNWRQVSILSSQKVMCLLLQKHQMRI